MENRLEKKFVYEAGDLSFHFFLISGMFKKIHPKRIVNSIYLDSYSHKDAWDNINGFGNRKKIRIRWYNKLLNSKAFLEVKKKIGFITQKQVAELKTFKNFNELNLFINQENYMKNDLIIDKQINLKKILFVQYKRNYYELPNKKLRITIDNNLKIFQDHPLKYIDIDKTIVELKYKVENSSYVNDFIKKNYLHNRNQKFSKYVNSFLEIYENGYI